MFCRKFIRKESLFLGFAAFLIVFFSVSYVQQASALTWKYMLWNDTDNIGYNWPWEAKIKNKGILKGFTDSFYFPRIGYIKYGGVSWVNVEYKCYAPENLGWNSFVCYEVKLQVKVYDGSTKIYDSGEVEVYPGGDGKKEGTKYFEINKNGGSSDRIKVHIAVYGKFIETYYDQNGLVTGYGRTSTGWNNIYRTFYY